MSIEHIKQLLIEQNILNQEGCIKLDLANISFPVKSKDIIGGALQEWFENWMLKNSILFTKPENSQEPPDFFLENGEHLEVKVFNADANPGFDIANFDAYTRSLLQHPERLDAHHLVFGYVSKNALFKITNFWVKKVWEMTGTSKLNVLALQVKQNSPVNIRPKDWRGKSELFSSRREFVIALDQALIKFHPERYIDWFSQVETAYREKTGNSL
jgi:type II restriction enzyme